MSERKRSKEKQKETERQETCRESLIYKRKRQTEKDRERQLKRKRQAEQLIESILSANMHVGERKRDNEKQRE